MEVNSDTESEYVPATVQGHLCSRPIPSTRRSWFGSIYNNGWDGKRRPNVSHVQSMKNLKLDLNSS